MSHAEAIVHGVHPRPGGSNRRAQDPWPGQTGRVNDADLLSSLVADVGVVANVLRASPEASIVHCPGWNVVDLVGHHGGVLRWAEGIARAGEPVVDQLPPPASEGDRASWYVDAATGFVTTVSTLDRNRPCWTFGRPPERLWFWIRRQALEAGVHRWDAELASGVVPELRSDLCSVGITEVVEDLLPRQIALGRTAPLSHRVELRAEDTDQRWVLPTTGTADGATVTAPAMVLFLLLWRRTDLEDRRIRFSGSELVRDELQVARFAP